MNTEKITARRLTTEEISELGLQEDIFVSAEMNDLPLDCYAPAFLTKPGKNFEGGSFTARTIFGQEIHVLPDNAEERGIWVADETGEEIEVLQSAGVLLNLALFVPNGNKESLESLYTAARKAFGAGIVQRWNEEVVAVPDVKVDLFEEPTRRAEEHEQPEPRPPRLEHLPHPSAVHGAQRRLEVHPRTAQGGHRRHTDDLS